jgi:hypothetical protein
LFFVCLKCAEKKFILKLPNTDFNKNKNEKKENWLIILSGMASLKICTSFHGLFLHTFILCLFVTTASLFCATFRFFLDVLKPKEHFGLEASNL